MITQFKIYENHKYNNISFELKLMVSKYGGVITMLDLVEGESPAINVGQDDDDIILLDTLLPNHALCTQYGGHSTELGQFNVPYEDMGDETIYDLIAMIEDAAEDGLIDVDDEYYSNFLKKYPDLYEEYLISKKAKQYNL